MTIAPDLAPTLTPPEGAFAFHDDLVYLRETKVGLSRETVEEISRFKGEPDWMLQYRLRAYEHFLTRPMPDWGGDLSRIDFGKIVYYRKPSDRSEKSWDDVPDQIKATFEKLGIPEAERKFLAGVGAQYDCLAAGTRVLTARGYQPIENVQVGDTVFSLDEATDHLIPSPVAAVIPKGKLKVFKVTVGTRTIRVTGNHPFLSLPDGPHSGPKSSRESREWLYLRDLRAGYWVAVVDNAPDIDFARINWIESAGVEETFDLAIDGPHNFVAEGLLVHNSEVVYHSVREELSKIGVVFMGTDQALKEYPEIFRKYFGTVVPAEDNKFAALNAAVWSGGSYVFVPKGVEVPLPLQAYFRINGQNTGQFERTLIIVEEGAKVHYLEGCLYEETFTSTPSGPRRIDEMAPGELVLTHGGRWRAVTQVHHRKYQGPVVRIRALGQALPLQATADHPLYILRAGYDLERPLHDQQTILAAEQVRPGDFLVLPIPRSSTEPLTELVRHYQFGSRVRKADGTQEDEVRVPLNEHFYRLLGYYLAEGNVNQEHYLLLSFNAQEHRYLAEAAALLREFSGKDPIWNKERLNGRSLVLCHTALSRLFAREFGSNHREKHIPAWVLSTKLENLSALVSGMWYGDGSYDVKKEMFRYSTVTLALAEAFREALFRLGITGFINCQKRGGNRKPLYSVVIAAEHNELFAGIVGVSMTFGRPRRADAYRSWLRDDDYLYLRVRKVELSEDEQEVYNLSVEEDETYVAGGVASHNCTAPIYATDSLHAAVVEVIALPHSKVRYTTIQNWSNDVYNLVTKRAHAYEDARVEWIDANTGCLAYGTMVARGDEMIPIEDLRVGDYVRSLNLEFHLVDAAVTATRVNAPGPLFDLDLADQRTIRATPNHPFLVARQIDGARTVQWLPLASIVPGDEVAIMDTAAGAATPATPVRFVAVVAMTYAGDLPSIDIEVEDTANFIANGIVAHNSQLTMKYPSIYLRGRGASADIITVAVAGKGQHQDTGAKAVHLAPDTHSRIVSKSISHDGGRATYRGTLKVAPGATGVVASVRCDALMLDDFSRSDTYPYIDIQEDDTTMTHEATVGKISADQVFYLMSRGLTENEAQNLIIQGYMEIFTKELPMEYAIEFNRLIRLEMTGAIG